MKKDEKNKSVDVIFCGLVRDIDLSKKTIGDLILLRKKGLVDKIIISTWKGEIQKTPELQPFLKENNILILESEEPEDRGDGNVWCQMKSLEVGLNYVDKDRFVLKTRTDVYINPDFLEKLFSEKEKILKIVYHLPQGDIFRYKIWVPWFEITKPFFMGDECFFGHKGDLMLLVNYDCSFDTENYLGPDTAHVRRFIYPFLNNYPDLRDFFAKFNKERYFKNSLKKFSHKLYVVLTGSDLLRRISERNRFKILNKRLKDYNFLNLLATSYIILYSHFYIDSSSFPDQVLFKGKSKPILKSNSFNLEDNFSRERVLGGELKGKFVKYGGQIYIYDMDFLKSLFEKKMDSTPLFEKLTEIIDKLNVQAKFKNTLSVNI